MKSDLTTELEIQTPFYRAVVSRTGGRIISLCFPDGWDWCGSGGIAEDVEGGLPGQLGRIDYKGEPAARGSETLLDLVAHGCQGAMVDWGMTVRKSFRFHADHPCIDICLRLENLGAEPRAYPAFRIHNAICSRADSIFFTRGAGVLETFAFDPGRDRYVHRFASGLSGCVAPDAGQALICLADRTDVGKYLFYMSASVSTVEWFVKSVVVPPGGAWETAYQIAPVPAKGIDDIDAALRRAGLREADAVRPRRHRNAARMIKARESGLKLFADAASLLLAKQAVEATGVEECNLRTADGWIHDRVLTTPHGAGFDLVLPESSAQSLHARVTLRAGNRNAAEAYLLCCSPDGRPYRASIPARLDCWNPAATIRLDVTDLHGKAVRLALLGPEVCWTDLRLRTDKGDVVLFEALGIQLEDPAKLAGVAAGDRRLMLEASAGNETPHVRCRCFDADGGLLATLLPKAAPGRLSIAPGDAASMEIHVRRGDRQVSCRYDLPPVSPPPRSKGILIEVVPAGDTAAKTRCKAGLDGVSSLAEARDRIRSLRVQGVKKAVTVLVRRGTYRLSKPLTFTLADSGTARAPVVYRAEDGARVVISGGHVLRGSWRERADGSWEYALPAGCESFRRLSIDGDSLVCARWPRTGALKVERLDDDEQGRPRLRVLNADLAQAPDLLNAELCARYVWCGERFNVAHVDREKGSFTLSRQPHSPKRVVSSCFFENVPDPDLLPGQWYLDRAARKLVYRPRAGDVRGRFAPVAPRLRELLCLRGNRRHGCVRHVAFQGFEFRDSLCTEQDEGMQAACRVGGAVVLEHAEHCALQGNRFRNLEGAAIELRAGCRRNVVADNELVDLDGGGIRIGLDHRNPREGDAFHSVSPTGGNIVSGNHIHRIGQRYPGAIGIWIGQSGDNLIVGNRLHDLPYTGISAGWTWGRGANPARGNRIEGNRLVDVMLEMEDGAAIYTLGDSPGTTIRYNKIRNVPNGSGIYLDEGSAGIHITGNEVSLSRTGLFLHGACVNLVEGNRFSGASQTAVLLGDCAGQMADNVIVRNRFARGSAGGLLLSASGWHPRFLSRCDRNRMVGWNLRTNWWPAGECGR